MYDKPRKYFIRMLLLTLITLFNIFILATLVGAGDGALLLAVVLAVANAFFILYMLVIAFMNIFKAAKDKEKSNVGFHIVNLLLSLVITAIFGLFYITVIFGAMIILLPFL